MLVLAAACNQSTKQEPDKAANAQSDTLKQPDAAGEQAPARPQDDLMVPGEKLGKLSLNTDVEMITAILGKPDSSDAAMGKAWLTWFGRQETAPVSELNVYTTYKDRSLTTKTVQLIRTTSPQFRTGDGIGVQSLLTAIGKSFSTLHYVASYKNNRSGKSMSLYEAVGQGIGFEISQEDNKQQCTAVMIFDKGSNLLQSYQTFLNANGWEKQTSR